MWNLQFNGIQDGNCQGSIVDIQQSAWLQVELLVEHEDAEESKNGNGSLNLFWGWLNLTMVNS